MNAEAKNRYFQELPLNLRHEGFAVKPETEEGFLPVELDGQRLCLALDTGSVRCWREDTADDHRSAALDRAISITKTTAEYMCQMDAAPHLRASGLTGDYRLLADFNDVVLAGHPTASSQSPIKSQYLFQSRPFPLKKGQRLFSFCPFFGSCKSEVGGRKRRWHDILWAIHA